MTPTKKLTNAFIRSAPERAAAARRHAYLDLYRIIDASLMKSYTDYPDHPAELALANAIKPITEEMPDNLVSDLRQFFRERFLKI